MSFLWDKKCIFIYGKKCCVLGSALIACVLFVGIITGYGVMVAYFQADTKPQSHVITEVVSAPNNMNVVEKSVDTAIVKTEGVFSSIVRKGEAGLNHILNFFFKRQSSGTTLLLDVQ